jgi:very-short-patch-repair endonuclease
MTHFNRTPGKTVLARRLRRDGTDVEKKLWHRLRNGQISNAHFRRQHPAGPYILDFYCSALALDIELDGGQHTISSTRDRERDAWLKQKGVTVLRFWNTDVIENMNSVLEVIAAKISELRSRAVSSHPQWRFTATDPHPALTRRPPPFRGR